MLYERQEMKIKELENEKVQYHTIITEAELERQRYQIEVENLLKELRGSVQSKKKLEERIQISVKT